MKKKKKKKVEKRKKKERKSHKYKTVREKRESVHILISVTVCWFFTSQPWDKLKP